MNRKKTMATLLIAMFMISIFAVVMPVSAAIAITSVGDVDGNPISGGMRGDTVVVNGSGIVAGVPVNLYWDIAMGDDAYLLNTTLANPDGTFEVWFRVPVTAIGDHYLWVKDTNTLEYVSFGPFTVTGLADISLDPAYGSPGATVEIVGENFNASVNVSIELWDKNLTAKIIDIATLETDENGDFSGSFFIPAVNFGTYRIVAQQDNYQINASKILKIGLMALIINPSKGPTGAEVSMTGIGFTENGVWNATFGEIGIFYNETVGAGGAISGLFNVPMVDVGIYTITVLDIETEIELHVDFSVTNASACAVSMTVTVEQYPPVIVSINVDTTFIDFGTIKQGNTSDPKPVTITNTGDLDVNVTASVTETEPLFYYGCLLFNGTTYNGWGVTIPHEVPNTHSIELTLNVPIDAVPGLHEGTLIFWAEEA